MASIEQRNGKFMVRWRINGKPRTKTFSTLKQAQHHKANVEQEISAGTALDPARGQTTFRVWREQWTENRQNVKANTLSASKSLYNAHMSLSWDTWRLDAITQQDVQKWVNGIVKKGRSASTVRAAYKDFSQCLRAAVTPKYIRESPCYGINLPPIEHEELVLLDHAEIAKLADKIKGRYSALILTLAYSGIRVGEAAALKWPQVDLEAGTIRIIATASEHVGSGIVTTKPKSKAGIRTVPIPHHLVTALRAHKDKYSATGWVFTSSEGQQLNTRNFNRRSFKTAKDALSYDLTIHDLRHTAISLWIRAGIDLVRIKTWAGHTDAAFTANIYGHLFPTDDAALVETLNSNIVAALETAEVRYT